METLNSQLREWKNHATVLERKAKAIQKRAEEAEALNKYLGSMVDAKDSQRNLTPTIQNTEGIAYKLHKKR